MKVRRGQEQKVAQIFEEWDRERKPNLEGEPGGFLLKPDNKAGELFGAAIFEDKAAYMANADDPERDRWYGRLRPLLPADPEWEDGEHLAGGVG